MNADLQLRFHPAFGVLCGLPPPPSEIPDAPPAAPVTDWAAPVILPTTRAARRALERADLVMLPGFQIRVRRTAVTARAYALLARDGQWRSTPAIACGIVATLGQVSVAMLTLHRAGSVERRGSCHRFQYRAVAVSNRETDHGHNDRLDAEQDPTAHLSRARISRQPRSSRP